MVVDILYVINYGLYCTKSTILYPPKNEEGKRKSKQNKTFQIYIYIYIYIFVEKQQIFNYK